MKWLYNSFNGYLLDRFSGRRVRKIPINAGFPCPNKDGQVSTEGCIFCDVYGSGPIKYFHLSIPEQIESVLAHNRQKDFRFIAYYQAHSNTSAPVEELRRKYGYIFNYPEIVGLFIGTRPDAIAEPVYPLLEELNQKLYLTVELGLQTVHPRSLAYLNRNHTYETFLNTFAELKARNIDTLVHLIIGIPGESREDMMATVREMNRLKPAGVKFHLLHVLKNTRLLDMYRAGEFQLMGQEEYIELMADLLEHLDPDIVIHRLTGERDQEIFVEPRWTLSKNAVIQAIRRRLTQRGTHQGYALGAPPKG